MRGDIRVLQGKAQTLGELSENKEIQQMANLVSELANIIDESVEEIGFSTKAKK